MDTSTSKQQNHAHAIDKPSHYATLYKQIEALTASESDLIANLANTSSVLYHGLEDLNWVGFYIVKDDLLILGPFQGLPACNRIELGKGVCGYAAESRTTTVVDDVHAFAGHIACDGASNSEIVIPIQINNKVVAVLDVDSPKFARFDELDRQGLENICRIIESYWK